MHEYPNEPDPADSEPQYPYDPITIEEIEEEIRNQRAAPTIEEIEEEIRNQRAAPTIEEIEEEIRNQVGAVSIEDIEEEIRNQRDEPHRSGKSTRTNKPQHPGADPTR